MAEENNEIFIEELKKDIEVLITDAQIKVKDLDNRAEKHEHRGYDRSKKLDKFIYPTKELHGTVAATAANYGVFFIASVPCTVIEIKEVHRIAGTDDSNVTLDIERLQGTESLGSGDELISGAFDLKASINTVRTATLVTTNVVNLDVDDRLALKDTGTLTNVVGVTIMVKIKLNI